jgi:hypothetical protein
MADISGLLDFDAGVVGGVGERVRVVPAGTTSVCNDRYGCRSVEDFATQLEDERIGMVGGARQRRKTRKTRRRQKRRQARSGAKRSVRVRINVRWPARQNR